MTPADLARSSINPLIERGIVDVLCTTGANLYHDATAASASGSRRAPLRRRPGTARGPDHPHLRHLLRGGCPAGNDKFFARVIQAPEFQRPMTTPEFHRLLGRYMVEVENRQGLQANRSLLSTCHLHGVPIFCGAPQDGSIFLNVVRLQKTLGDAFRFRIDLPGDIYEYAAYQYWAQHQRLRQMAVVILGGGVPKNYTLQAEPLLSQIFFIDAGGFDIDVQISDANVHTGGLSGCPASEGHTWARPRPSASSAASSATAT